MRPVSSPSTSRAVSPDSGRHWSEAGAWPVAPGVHRIPLPLPSDGLRAVNVYALETDDGLTMVDGGWSIPEARDLLASSLASIGYGFGDVRRFLVTHVHRDHYTLASVIAREVGAEVSLGLGDKPTLDLVHAPERTLGGSVALLRESGADDLAEQWARPRPDSQPTADPTHWGYPDHWFETDHDLDLGSRTLAVVHTPGHTQGHVVFADHAGDLLFAGDHVLPTITPSIGFEPVPVRQPLRDFMDSLTKVRGLPDLRLLPAHGPVADSTHVRVDALLAHHEDRLRQCAAALAGGVARTPYEVAGVLAWTRHEHALDDLDVFNAALATMETKAHLELLVSRGRATRATSAEGVVSFVLA